MRLRLFGDWTKLGRSLGNLIHLTTGLRCHGFDLDSLTDVVTVRDPFLFSLNSKIETADSADFTDFKGVIGVEPTNPFVAQTQGIDNRNLLYPCNL